MYGYAARSSPYPVDNGSGTLFVSPNVFPISPGYTLGAPDYVGAFS
jgi:hypothetical protein